MERGAKGEKQFAISITGSTYLRAGLALLLSLILSHSLETRPIRPTGFRPTGSLAFLMIVEYWLPVAGVLIQLKTLSRLLP